MADDARPERQPYFNVASDEIYRWHAPSANPVPGAMSQILESAGYVPADPTEPEPISLVNTPSQPVTEAHVEPPSEGGETGPGEQKRRRRTRRSPSAAMTSTAMDPARSPEQMHEPWLTRQDAARYLGIHPNTLDELRRKGKIKPLYITERNMRYPISELERYTREQQGLPPLGPVVMPPAPDPGSRPKRQRARPWNAKD